MIYSLHGARPVVALLAEQRLLRLELYQSQRMFEVQREIGVGTARQPIRCYPDPDFRRRSAMPPNRR